LISQRFDSQKCGSGDGITPLQELSISSCQNCFAVRVEQLF
jgi:hypothetical protein